MKKLLLMAVLGISTSVFFSGCKKDPCKDVVCQNSGVPTESTDGESCNCECTVGYEGEFCETESRAKFIGTYNVSDVVTGNAGNDGTYTYESSISTGSAPTEISISNFAGFQTTIKGTIKDTRSFTIEQQTDAAGRKYSGNGTIDGTTVTILYTLVYTDGTTDNGTATYTRK